MTNALNFRYPTADATTLMGQATMTVHDYLHHAKAAIDKIFGEGYAALHPELVGAYIQAAASDFNAAILAKAVGAGLAELCQVVSGSSNQLMGIENTLSSGVAELESISASAGVSHDQLKKLTSAVHTIGEH